jgi:hypothetical protein
MVPRQGAFVWRKRPTLDFGFDKALGCLYKNSQQRGKVFQDAERPSAAWPQSNPKHEFRNPKQIRMTKIRMTQTSEKSRREKCLRKFREIGRKHYRELHWAARGS